MKPQVVIHTAAVVGSPSLRYTQRERPKTWRVNVIGTKNTLEEAKISGVEAFVYTSSTAAVTDDMDTVFANVDERWPTCHSSLPYGESKAIDFLLYILTTSTNIRSAVLDTGVCADKVNDLVRPPRSNWY